MKNIILIFTSLLMGAAGQILLKIGVNKLGDFNLTFKGVITTIFTPYIIVGLSLFTISFVLWLKVLTRNNLSYVYPLVSINYIVIAIASKYLLNEGLSFTKIIGITIIICGVIVINIK